MVEEKEEIEEEIEAKKEKVEKSWWTIIPTWIIVVGCFLIFLSLRGATMENGGMSQILILVAVVFILIMLSKKYKTQEVVLSPKEAEILTERELERKRSWGQYSNMDRFQVGPIINPQHRDGRGMYYDIAVTITNPYKNPVHLIAKVTMKGPERGYVGFIESVGKFTGREKYPERTIWGVTRKLREDDFFKGMWKGRE